jgi:hypothetical protein
MSRLRLQRHGILRAVRVVLANARNMHNVQTEELVRLDELLEELSKETGAQCELLREHLVSARTSLIGSMPAEYALNLRMAGEALSCVSDQNLHARIKEFIREGSSVHEGRQDAGKEDSGSSSGGRPGR